MVPSPSPSPSRALQPAKGAGAASLIQIYDGGCLGLELRALASPRKVLHRQAPWGPCPPSQFVMRAGVRLCLRGEWGFVQWLVGVSRGAWLVGTMLQPLGDLDAMIAHVRTSTLSKAGPLPDSRSDLCPVGSCFWWGSQPAGLLLVMYIYPRPGSTAHYRARVFRKRTSVLVTSIWAF